ncbi:thyroid transcription factor 1-associated protein 26 homolog [Patella vulgata]|uniref:thyroid transcription factor 1-associated protein 26 homolog n=1 Tax=Patella vulgata TaxID=6465 RepID=UPI00217FA2D8|nr:thyroid transcription factor 1-associated protein 26 homolog [Patella vulgata]
MSEKIQKYGANRAKPYDKSRLYKKHIGNKSEGQGFADLRKQKIKRGYFKLMKKQDKKKQSEETPQGSKDITSDEETFSDKQVKLKRDKIDKLNRFSKAKEEFQKNKEEEIRKKEAALKEKEAREEALRKYHERKNEKHNKFKLKTSKGQPIMKYRMQDLLQQIQTMKSKEKQ